MVYTICMDLKKPGFTIIELIIAMSIVVVLMAVAIPRMTLFSRAQDFSNRAQKVVECIQSAQQAAASPGSELASSPRFTSVTIQPSTDGSIDCISQSIGATYSSGGPVTVDQLKDLSIEPEIITSSTQTIPDVIMSTGNNVLSVRLYFGVVERGAPVLYCQDTGTPMKICQNSKTAVIAADGLPQSVLISLEDPTSRGKTKGVITINQSGNPITYDSL